MINAILIEVLGSIAENERLKIRRRQREGIDAAKKKNIKFGRPALKLPENWKIVMQAVEAKQITVSQAIDQLHICTFLVLPTIDSDKIINFNQICNNIVK